MSLGTATISVCNVNERGRLVPTESFVVRIWRESSASKRERNEPRPRTAEYKCAVKGFNTRPTWTRPCTANANEMDTLGFPFLKLPCPSERLVLASM